MIIHARRRDAAAAVADLARRMGVEATVADLTPVPADCDLVVSTLPADVAGPWTQCVQAADRIALVDAIYHPWPTPLADAWLAYGSGPVVSGRDMLVWQAVAQVRLMTGQDFDESSVVSVMREAL